VLRVIVFNLDWDEPLQITPHLLPSSRFGLHQSSRITLSSRYPRQAVRPPKPFLRNRNPQDAFFSKDTALKLADIPPGSDIAYRSAAKIVAEQVEFELETCRRLLGTEPEKVLELLANTPDLSVFLEDEDL